MGKLKLFEFDHLAIGIVLGLLFPLLIMHFWLQQYSNLSLLDIIRNPIYSEILDILKGGLFVNLGVFFLFYWLRKDKSARGVVFATLIYGAFYLFYMFFM